MSIAVNVTENTVTTTVTDDVVTVAIATTQTVSVSPSTRGAQGPGGTVQKLTLETITGSKLVSLLDNGKFIRCNSAGVITITLPALTANDAGVAITFKLQGAGSIAFATSGSTIESPDSLVTVTKQYGVATAVLDSATVWSLFGELA